MVAPFVTLTRLAPPRAGSSSRKSRPSDRGHVDTVYFDQIVSAVGPVDSVYFAPTGVVPRCRRATANPQAIATSPIHWPAVSPP